MENNHHLQSNSFMPLLSRVDRLDSVMKYIEKKEKLSRWRKCSSLIDRKDRQGVPMSLNVAAQEAHTKGSLMDRIRSLEDRLLQLSQEIDQTSSKASSSSSIQSTSLWTTSSSSCGRSKSELPVSSYPTYNYPINPELPKPQSHDQVLTNVREYFQKDSHELQQRLKHDHVKQQQQEEEQQQLEVGRDEENKRKNGKKKRSLNWPRLKLLGC